MRAAGGPHVVSTATSAACKTAEKSVDVFDTVSTAAHPASAIQGDAMLTPDSYILRRLEVAIRSTRAAVHDAYSRHRAALRRGDALAAVAAAIDARDAMREHEVAFSRWLDAART